jgi:hypothetical protein
VSLIRPRLTDHHGVFCAQSQVPFAIPFLDEDIPLYVDPFLLWKSKSQQDKALHLSLVNSFNHLGYLAKNGKSEEALTTLIRASECDEVGLGVSPTRTGKRISREQGEKILGLFHRIPQYERRGFHHFEEIQFFVDGISKDRICDLACNFIKSFLIDFTMDECERLGIPLADCVVKDYYDPEQQCFLDNESQKLPVNPRNGTPLLLVPKRWLRYTPWLSFDNYFKQYCPRDQIFNPGEPEERVKVLTFNRENYGVVEAYVKEKELTAEDCLIDPLFTQIPVLSAKRKMLEINRLPTGNENKADKKYENAIAQLMASLLYPHLDFATDQSRTDSGVLIRDLIFYNNQSHPFLSELFNDYGSKQLVMEIKNVRAVEREHVEQLNRYMAAELGAFGVLITRNELSRARFKSTIDLWSGQRKCIVSLTDVDLEQMVELFDSKQRLPLDVLKKKYVEFRRACPA